MAVFKTNIQNSPSKWLVNVANRSKSIRRTKIFVFDLNCIHRLMFSLLLYFGFVCFFLICLALNFGHLGKQFITINKGVGCWTLMLVIVSSAVSICVLFAFPCKWFNIWRMRFATWMQPNRSKHATNPPAHNKFIDKMLRWTIGLICHNTICWIRTNVYILYAFWCLASYFIDFSFLCDYFRCFVFLLRYSNKLTIWLCSQCQRVQSLWTSICRHTIMVNTKSNKSKISKWMNEMKIEIERKGNRDRYIFGHEISCVCAPKIDRHMHSENRMNKFIKLCGVNGTRGQDMIPFQKQQLPYVYCSLHYT